MPGEHQGVKEVVNDLWLLCRDYAKQETIEPLKPLKGFLSWGLLGPSCCASASASAPSPCSGPCRPRPATT